MKIRNMQSEEEPSLCIREDGLGEADCVEAMMSYEDQCLLLLRCDLCTDSYQIIHRTEMVEEYLGKDAQTLSEFLRIPCEQTLILEGDMADYTRYASYKYLVEFFEKYRAHTGYQICFGAMMRGRNYKICMEIFPDRKYSDENKAIYIMYKEIRTPVESRHIPFDNVLSELSESFESIYYVDFDQNKVYPYRMNPDIRKEFGDFLETNPTYEKAIHDYIEKDVIKSDQKEMYAICDKKYLEKKLRKSRAFSHSFRAKHNGVEENYRIKISNMEGAGELHRGVIGFTNIDMEKTVDQEMYCVGKTVLLIENENLNREILRMILEDDYQILEAQSAEEGLQFLQTHFEEISLVLTNLEMPDGDGYEFVRQMRNIKKYESIPLIVMTTFDTEDTEIKCLEMGASDFIIKPYNPRIVLNRVKNLIQLRESTAFLNVIEKDSLTGFYTKEAFYRYAQNLLDSHPKQRYMIVVSDIENFKMINDRYGRKMGDDILRYFTGTRTKKFGNECFGGRLGADVMAWIKPEEPVDDQKVSEMVNKIQNHAPIPNLVVKYGHYHTRENDKLSIQQMCDRAIMAANSIKGEYGHYYAEYDDKIHQELVFEQQIINSMEAALENQEFRVYYQPKCNLYTGKTEGAEALVRWNHPELGLLTPDRFIPIFENNGFVINLDRYIVHAVCKKIRSWMEQDQPVVSVSINLSRKDFDREDLAERITKIVDQYHIPHQYLHFEVTESAFSDNRDRMVHIVKKLHEQGFLIELDDFGTGYSSITALNNMDVDILKLDMSIINEDNEGSERNALDVIMTLVKMMNLTTVQEGVETRKQMERVKELGCDYIQGYYCAKPLPANEFECYLQREAGRM